MLLTMGDVMSKAVANSYNSELLELFRDTTLGLYLDGYESDIFALGETRTLAGGAVFDATDERLLNVILDGRLTGVTDWFGPGNHFGPQEHALQVSDQAARIWTLDTSALPGSLRRVLAKALLAADAAELNATPPADLPDPATLCDVDHPEIRRAAVRLRRATPASTADAILKFVHAMPYRFGAWQERASDTLARGVGMCTTKANLQVALMRAAGLEAGFVEVPMSTGVLGKLMPAGWLALQRPTVRHYFAAVKLNGRWHGVDSSYDVASYRIYLEMFPWMAHRETPEVKDGAPYMPALEIQHADLFDIQVVESIAEEMGKKSRFLTRHFEALNTCMDRARGTHLTWRKGLDTPAAESVEDEARA